MYRKLNCFVMRWFYLIMHTLYDLFSFKFQYYDRKKILLKTKEIVKYEIIYAHDKI